jgi:hypothetical protein
MSASIGRALSVSRGNPYVAAELLEENVPGDPYWDIRWVRGTNTSVFLSCYFEDDEWKLLAKGSQMHRGFVPMMETVDAGINATFGTNQTMISGYPPSHIRGSGEWSTREQNVTIFDPVTTARRLQEIFEDRPSPGYFAKIIFSFLRIRQWGDDAEAGQLLRQLDFKNTDWYAFEKAELKRKKDFFRSVPRLLADDFERYIPAAQAARESGNTGDFFSILGMASEEYHNLGNMKIPWDFFADDMKKRGTDLKIMIINSFDFASFSSFFRWVFVFKVLGSDDDKVAFYEVTRGLPEKAVIGLERTEFWERFFESAIDLETAPAYQLNSIDKEILEDPISIVVASTAQSGIPVSKTNETNIFDSITFGPSGVDVIYVRAFQREALERVLRMARPPIEDVEIRVDDSVFM